MQLQLDRLDVPAKPGVAFSLVKKLLLEEPDLDVTGALRATLKALAKGKV